MFNMSLGVVIKGPEGLVLAADSRITLEAIAPNSHPIHVSYDNATKLLSFNKEPNHWFGAVTYGAAVIGLRTAHSYIPEFELDLENKHKGKRIKVENFAQELSDFFFSRWKEEIPGDYSGPGMTFVVAGFDQDSAYGKVYIFTIPSQPSPGPRHRLEKEFGMTWGGQLSVVSRLIHGYDPILLKLLKEKCELNDKQIDEIQKSIKQNIEYNIPYDILPLQDCVDLAIFLIRTTISAQGLAIGLRGVGGPIDIATISSTKGLEPIQRKNVHGESIGGHE